MRIVSHSSESFKDRKHAGRLLVTYLKDLGGKDTVVLGIPRGGIVIANEISRILNSELDIVLSRKIGAPDNPELAIGSIGEDGKLFLNEDLSFRVGADKDYIAEEKALQLREIENRIGLFRHCKAKITLKGKTVIVTDDGVATGATMQAALWAAGKENPKKLISAIPVGAEESVRFLANYADEVIVLRVPLDLGAIGQFYKNFTQIQDEEVLEILKESAK
ncbi:MAG: phosphoribosyltransferase family protein [Candidatus Omnitrophica bacterium]|nr:phosphoribosyltransferase family protein [Candidatus Omnitrophota bacterium]